MNQFLILSLCTVLPYIAGVYPSATEVKFLNANNGSSSELHILGGGSQIDKNAVRGKKISNSAQTSQRAKRSVKIIYTNSDHTGTGWGWPEQEDFPILHIIKKKRTRGSPLIVHIHGNGDNYSSSVRYPGYKYALPHSNAWSAPMYLPPKMTTTTAPTTIPTTGTTTTSTQRTTTPEGEEMEAPVQYTTTSPTTTLTTTTPSPAYGPPIYLPPTPPQIPWGVTKAPNTIQPVQVIETEQEILPGGYAPTTESNKEYLPVVGYQLPSGGYTSIPSSGYPSGGYLVTQPVHGYGYSSDFPVDNHGWTWRSPNKWGSWKHTGSTNLNRKVGRRNRQRRQRKRNRNHFSGH